MFETPVAFMDLSVTDSDCASALEAVVYIDSTSTPATFPSVSMFAVQALIRRQSVLLRRAWLLARA